MTEKGSAFSSLFNVSGDRYDLLEVWNGVAYINVADALNSLVVLPDQIASDEARIQTLEDKTQSLEDNKAEQFIAIIPTVYEHICFTTTAVCPRDAATFKC